MSVLIRIETRLFATFRLGRRKVVEVEVEKPATPEKVLMELGIEKGEVAILLVNGRSGKMDQELDSKDYLSVFPPVGGG